MIFRLMQEDGHFHAIGYPELVYNAIQIRSFHTVEIHILLADYAENTFAIQKQHAFQHRTAHDLVLHISFLIEALINNAGEIDALRHHSSGYLHGALRGVAVFEYVGVMKDSGVDALSHFFADFLLIQKIIEQLAGCAGICFHKVCCGVALVCNVMIDADAGLCGIQIHHVLSQAFPVSAVQADAQIILLSSLRI